MSPKIKAPSSVSRKFLAESDWLWIAPQQSILVRFDESINICLWKKFKFFQKKVFITKFSILHGYPARFFDACCLNFPCFIKFFPCPIDTTHVDCIWHSSMFLRLGSKVVFHRLSDDVRRCKFSTRQKKLCCRSIARTEIPFQHVLHANNISCCCGNRQLNY